MFAAVGRTAGPSRVGRGNGRRRLRVESLEKRYLLAAALDADAGLDARPDAGLDARPDAGLDAIAVGASLPETESVFWQDRSVEIRRGQWVVQFDRRATAGPQSGDRADALANAQAWLQRRQPKQVISVDADIERRLYEFDDLLIRSAMLHAFENSPNVVSVEPNYRVAVDAARIRTAEGTAMIRDYVWGQQNVDAFFRLFGDTDGDRDVHGQDYGRFGLSFLKSGTDPAFNPHLDSDGDGDVDGQDYGRFGLNFLKRLGDAIR
ncbi:hypothetical protein TBK1r_30200 [Stieleria magnilauensis]|uniref:Planctomycete extracellular domain-containing protein n=2 Tax=Stieleria magnilauensis TaxID=2527963 RepID=A0ABX5XPZ0_9BACT|nr:hypothetical protein TBK1r_30200 [Planctomycetes bacterium TBK1r]